MVDLCQVCHQIEKKYRCPTCQINYCSLPCYKTHKSGCCTPVPPHIVDTTPCQDTVYQFQTNNTVPREKLNELAKSDELKQLLQNPHLRDFLTRLDSTENPVRIMRSAMQEPIFLEFVDTCLDLIDPKREMELTDEQVLEEVSNSMREGLEED